MFLSKIVYVSVYICGNERFFTEIIYSTSQVCHIKKPYQGYSEMGVLFSRFCSGYIFLFLLYCRCQIDQMLQQSHVP